MITNFKKNKSKNKFSVFLFRLGAGMVLCLALLLVFVDIRMYQKKRQFSAQLESLKAKVSELESKNNDLKEGISNADSEYYIAKVAREELDLQKPGEKVVSFISTQDEKQQNGNKKDNFLNHWLTWLSALFSNNHSTAD